MWSNNFLKYELKNFKFTRSTIEIYSINSLVRRLRPLYKVPESLYLLSVDRNYFATNISRLGNYFKIVNKMALPQKHFKRGELGAHQGHRDSDAAKVGN